MPIFCSRFRRFERTELCLSTGFKFYYCGVLISNFHVFPSSIHTVPRQNSILSTSFVDTSVALEDPRFSKCFLRLFPRMTGPDELNHDCMFPAFQSSPLQSVSKSSHDVQTLPTSFQIFREKDQL